MLQDRIASSPEQLKAFRQMRNQNLAGNGAEWSETQKQIHAELSGMFLYKCRLTLLEERTAAEGEILEHLNKQTALLEQHVNTPPSPPFAGKPDIHFGEFLKELRQKEAAAAQLDEKIAALEQNLPETA